MALALDHDQAERFWSKVDRTPGHGPDGDCWVWEAGLKNTEGYGGFYVRQIDNTVGAHKLSFLMAHDFGLEDIPESIVVRHRCNNPACVNPAHLVLGTHKDNSQDMVVSGNSKRGESNCNAKLTWERVRELRALWATGEWTKAALADRFGVSTAVVWHVVTNRTWNDPEYVPVEHMETQNHRVRYPQAVVEQVIQLRKAGHSYAEINAETGVSLSQISNIVRGRQRKGGVA